MKPLRELSGKHPISASNAPGSRLARVGVMPIVMSFTLLASWHASTSAQEASGARGWAIPHVGGTSASPRDKLAAFMSRWSFKLAHQQAEPARDVRLLASDSVPTQDDAQAPGPVQWHVSAQASGNDGTALVRSLGAVNGGDVDLFASVSRFWLGSEVGSHFMATAAARLARDSVYSWTDQNLHQGRPRQLQLEGGLGWLVRDDVVAGASYRLKSPAPYKTLLTEAAREEAWDVFVAWLPWWGGAVTLAWVNMASEPSQSRVGGVFLSGQIAY
jgi:hypothetical protein